MMYNYDVIIIIIIVRGSDSYLARLAAEAHKCTEITIFTRLARQFHLLCHTRVCMMTVEPFYR